MTRCWTCIHREICEHRLGLHKLYRATYTQHEGGLCACPSELFDAIKQCEKMLGTHCKYYVAETKPAHESAVVADGGGQAAILIAPIEKRFGGGWTAYRVDAPMAYTGDGYTPQEALANLFVCEREIHDGQ